MEATDLVNCPTTNAELAELACQLVAALAIDPIPCSKGPLRATTSAMAMVAKKHRTFFIDTPFLPAFQASNVRFTYPRSRRDVLAIEWAHIDLITKVSIRGKQRQLNTI